MFKPLPTFSDMPRHIKHRIVENTDTISKRKLHNTDRELRKMVALSSEHFQKIELKYTHLEIVVTYQLKNGKTNVVKYTECVGGCAIREDNQLSFSNQHFMTHAFRDFRNVFGRKYVKIERLVLIGRIGDLWREFWRKLNAECDKLGRKVHVEQLIMRLKHNHWNMLSFMDHLKPRILHTAEFMKPAYDFNAASLEDMDQWHFLKKVRIEGGDRLPVSTWKHCTTAILNTAPMPIDEIKLAIENALFQGKSFDRIHCKYIWSERDDILEYLFQYPHCACCLNYHIPSGNDVLQVKFMDVTSRMTITRMERDKIRPIHGVRLHHRNNHFDSDDDGFGRVDFDIADSDDDEFPDRFRADVQNLPERVRDLWRRFGPV